MRDSLFDFSCGLGIPTVKDGPPLKVTLLVRIEHSNEGSAPEGHQNRQRGHRPKLREFKSKAHLFRSLTYPFTIRVGIKGKPLSSVIHDVERLYSTFPSYRPIAVGMERTGAHGWVCLESEAELDRFITEFHGRVFDGETWRAFADYDPLIHRTSSETTGSPRGRSSRAGCSTDEDGVGRMRSGGRPTGHGGSG